MEFIHQLFSEEITYALGWTVVHSFWQAVAIAILLAFVQFAMREKTAESRYYAAFTALFLVLITSIITFIQLYQSAPGPNDLGPSTFIMVTQGQTPVLDNPSSLEGFYQQFYEYFENHLPLIVSIWLIGASFFMLKLLGGLVEIQLLKTRHVQALPAYWQNRMQAICDELGIQRKVSLLESAQVSVPMVLGYVRPVILMPIGAINALSSEEVEAILAHELAHIFRNDYLLNIIQSVIEILFYFNPAVWWISSSIRMERENCCDDIAVKLCGNSLTYAKALVGLQELNQRTPSLVMTFSKGKNQLLNRVRRILNQPQNNSNVMEKFTATCMLLFAMILFSVGSGKATETTIVHLFEEEEEITTTYENTETTDFEALENEEVSLLENIETIDVRRVNSIEENEIELDIQIFVDTIPNKGSIRIRTTHDGKEVELKTKNGEIVYLNIDGRKIPKSEYPKYEALVAQVIENIPPPPPAPPAPPSPEEIPAPPAPPAPPSPNDVPAPPTPPTPPNVNLPAPPPPPPAPGKSKKRKKGNGNTTMKLQFDNDGDNGGIWVIRTEDGNETVKELELGANGGIFIKDKDGELIKIEGDRIIFDDGNLEGIRLMKEQAENNARKIALFADEQRVKMEEQAKKLQEEMLIRQEKLMELKEQLQEESLENQEKLRAEAEELQREVLIRQKEMEREAFAWAQELNDANNLIMSGNNIKFLGDDGTIIIGDFEGEGRLDTDVKPYFEKVMLANKLVKDINNYKIKLSGKSLKINGKKMSSKIHKEFLEIYRDITGNTFGKNDEIIIKKKNK